MNFLALLLGLALERLLTALFHLREFRWLDPAFDRLFREAGTRQSWLASLVLFAGMVLAILPVVVVGWLLWDEFLQIPYFLFAVFVLLFSLGPRDLDQEVEDYCSALERRATDELARLSREITEEDTPNDDAARNAAVERAVFLQANNRIFGVVFWFLMLGPAGAWLFRVLDLMRRRARFQQGRGQLTHELVIVAPLVVLGHAVLAWIPARLLAAGYTLAGNFEDAARGWRAVGEPGLGFSGRSEELLFQVGIGATGRTLAQPSGPAEAYERLRSAMALVMRALWFIWCPVIAVLTLYEWLT